MRQAATRTVATLGMVACVVLFWLAWHRGVGTCNATSRPSAVTGVLLDAVLVIATADLAWCAATFRPSRLTASAGLMVAAELAITAAVGVATLALLSGVNFRGC